MAVDRQRLDKIITVLCVVGWVQVVKSHDVPAVAKTHMYRVPLVLNCRGPAPTFSIVDAISQLLDKSELGPVRPSSVFDEHVCEILRAIGHFRLVNTEEYVRRPFDTSVFLN